MGPGQLKIGTNMGERMGRTTQPLETAICFMGYSALRMLLADNSVNPTKPLQIMIQGNTVPPSLSTKLPIAIVSGCHTPDIGKHFTRMVHVENVGGVGTRGCPADE